MPILNYWSSNFRYTYDKIIDNNGSRCNTNILGVKIIENCSIQKVNQNNGYVSGVETVLGNIDCDFFVNCAGFWARGVGQLSEPYVKVPLHAVEHYYLHTKPIPGLDPMLPGINLTVCCIVISFNTGKSC